MPACTARSMSPSFVERGDHQDHDLARGGIGLQLLTDLEARQLGHHHVEQDQIGLERLDLGERILAVGGMVDLAIDARQIRFEQLEVGLDCRRRSGCGFCRPSLVLDRGRHHVCRAAQTSTMRQVLALIPPQCRCGNRKLCAQAADFAANALMHRRRRADS